MQNLLLRYYEKILLLKSAIFRGDYQNKGMYSVAAPSIAIRFDHAVAFWTAFYVKAFTIDASAMKRKTIRAALRKLCVLFEINFHWAYYDAKNDVWKFEELEHAT